MRVEQIKLLGVLFANEHYYLLICSLYNSLDPVSRKIKLVTQEVFLSYNQERENSHIICFVSYFIAQGITVLWHFAKIHNKKVILEIKFV